MSTREIDGKSTSNPGKDRAAVRKGAEAGKPGPEEDKEHEQKPAEQEEGSDSAEGADQGPVTAPPTFANAKTVFGMKRSNPTVKKGNDTYDYEHKYPEDAAYAEAAPAARVWRTYEDESRNHDANLVEESRDSVDVLLVFAGLFSAVVTTFVAQTSQSLQQDYVAMSASLLYESVLVQRAIANGPPTDSVAPSPLNPAIAFVPATTDVWVNGLWFTSLFLSLTTVLVAVLVKQWLHHYVALPSGTPRDRSFTRQFRHAGFQKWHVQVIIGLLPVLMHLALAIFLGGLVGFLYPLRAALSWIICVGTAAVYAAYVVTAILPIIFPQCPYRTPLCDFLYVSFCRIVPRVTWHNKEDLPSSQRGKFNAMLHSLPLIQARSSQSLAMIESKSVGQMSINLAAEALHWLFSVTSNPTVQSIVVQSIGGLPMASEEIFLSFQGDTDALDGLGISLLRDCLQGEYLGLRKPWPGMELKIGCLLRLSPRRLIMTWSFNTTDINSFELTVAILSNGNSLITTGPRESVSPDAFLVDLIRFSKLPPRCWYHLIINSNVLRSLDPDDNDHTNIFPLVLCSAILSSLDPSNKSLMQDFDSSLVRHFWSSVPYFLDKIYESVFDMLSKFVKDPSLDEPPLPQSLMLFVTAVKFMLHRLSLPEYDMSYSTIRWSLVDAICWIHRQSFSNEETTVVITVLHDILAIFVDPLRDTDSRWDHFHAPAMVTYRSLTTAHPSVCSLRGPRIIVDLMTSQWDQMSVLPDAACEIMTSLLVMRLPIAFTAFLERNVCSFLETV